MGGSERFVDPGTTAWDLVDEVLVRCPRCDAAATVRPIESGSHPAPPFARRRLTCASCGQVAEWPGDRDARITWSDDGHDPFFGLPLLLRTPCAGRVLWAYDERHLDLLERYVGARDRRRPSTGPAGRPQSLAERLPAWIKAAAHRDEVLAACARLRAELRASRDA